MSTSTKNTELWQGPPKPPPESMVAKDISCQGILAVTLRDALTGIHQVTQSEMEEAIDQDKDVVSEKASETNGNGYQDSHSVVTAGEKTTTDDENEKDKKDLSSKTILIGKPFVSSVMTAFGKSITKSHRELYEQQKNQSPTATTSKLPPSAVLRGRIASYSRHGAKWRILLKDARIRARETLPQSRPRKDDTRQSLWWYTYNDIERGVSLDQASQAIDEIVCPDLELLAYNDKVA